MPVAGLDRASGDADTVAVVGDVATVHHIRAVTVDGGYALGHECIPCALEIYVAFKFQTVVEESDVESEIDACGLLPL